MFFLGDKLKKLRTEKGLTTRELADLIGYSQAYISGLESGKKNPQPVVVEKLAEVLDVSSIFFFINSATVKDFFPVDFSDDIIEFVLDADNLSFLRMAVKLKENNITEETLNILLTLMVKSREAQERAAQKSL